MIAGNSTQFAHLLGLPYVEGGADPAVGFDCRGVVRWVNAMLGVEIPEAAMGGDGVMDAWEYLGDRYQVATQAGDVLASCASVWTEGDQAVADHVSVVTSPVSMLAMSAHRVGGVFQCKTYHIANVVGVYRWRLGA